MSLLSSLKNNKGSIKRRHRLGRGPSSGRGGTSTRGLKGQKKHGGRGLPYADFEGGQTRQKILHPEGGFTNNWAKTFTPLNISKLTTFISQNRLNPSHPITPRELLSSRCVSNVQDGIRLLAGGSTTLTQPLHIVVSRASAQAIAAVEKAGGSVWTRYYTPFAIRQIKAGKMDPVNSLQSRFPGHVARAAGVQVKGSRPGAGASVLVDEEGVEVDVEGKEGVDGESAQDGQDSAVEPEEGGVQYERRKYLYRLPDPTKRREIEYYRDPAHRGYLSHTVEEGQSPSLYWKVPKKVEKGVKAARREKKKLSENRLF